MWLSFQQRRWEKRERRRFANGFATWLPKPLTESQISAVVSYSPETLVVAGAGSGKTTLLLARAKYVVESQRSRPDRIPALAFNRTEQKMANPSHGNHP
jgi:DNA helicase-4